MEATAVLPDMPVSGGRIRLFVGAILMMAGLASIGCAARDFSTLRPGIDQRGHYIAGVPFFRQGEDSCGPAAIAGVASFWGRPDSVEAIKAKIYLPELRGTLPMDMERYLSDAGFRTISASGTLTQLKAYIRDNVPVICLLDLGFSVYRRPHYVTVIGYDDVNEVFIMHDGINANTAVGYEKFRKEWDRGGEWMLVVLPSISPPEGRP